MYPSKSSRDSGFIQVTINSNRPGFTYPMNSTKLLRTQIIVIHQDTLIFLSHIHRRMIKTKYFPRS